LPSCHGQLKGEGMNELNANKKSAKRKTKLHYIQLLDEVRQALITGNDTAFTYLMEARHRLSAGEEAVKKVAELEKRDFVWRNKKEMLENDLAKAWEKNTELEAENEKLKCCGNCDNKTKGNIIYCARNNKGKFSNAWFRYCHNWQPDGLTREEREK
jgi:hypothetical protein